ncbi:hypothetical protein [Streptomyces sp. Rer75]|uniref:hypothetical protein n=1 Tax=unclassified Streptomyces TaxID=2593676 RepID=UPI00359F797B
MGLLPQLRKAHVDTRTWTPTDTSSARSAPKPSPAAQNQALATAGAAITIPGTREVLDARNAALLNPAELTGAEFRAADTGLVLPDYGHAA